MTASPDNTQATAVALGSLTNAGDTLTDTGNNTSGTSAWYSMTVPSGDFLSLFRVAVTGDTGDEATLFWSIDGRTLAGPSADFTEAAMGGNLTLYVQVTGGTAGDTFTLAVSVIAGPPTSTQEDAATSLGTLTASGSTLTVSDSNEYGDVKWYSVSSSGYLSPVNFAVTGGTGDSLTLYQGASIAGITTNANESVSEGTAYIAVCGGTSGEEFTLTVTPPS
jgi:hypothetical protein